MKITLEDYNSIITFLNNYFRDEYFIQVVDSLNLQEKFEFSEYETEQDCLDYINLWFDVFKDSCDEDYEFYHIWNDLLCKLFSDRLEDGETYIEELDTTLYN